MKQRIGFLVICMAMMTADSNSLIIPAILAAVGAVLITEEEIRELFRKSGDGLREEEKMSVEEIAKLMFGEEFEDAKKNS